jgi:hypothetical protein
LFKKEQKGGNNMKTFAHFILVFIFCWLSNASAENLPMRTITNNTSCSPSIRLQIDPQDLDLSCYAVAETLPEGLSPININENGIWDANHHQLKWGPFQDEQIREFSYQLVGLKNAYNLTGVLSANGTSLPFTKDSGIVIDCDIPVVSIMKLPDQPVNAADYSIHITATEGIIEYRINASPWYPYTQAITIHEEGIYTVDARATDADENIGNAPPEHFIIDKSPPLPPDNLQSSSHEIGSDHCLSDNTVDISWDKPDGGPSDIQGYAIVWNSSNDTLPGEVIVTKELFGVSPELSIHDNHYVHIRAVDGAGNWSTNASHLGPFCIKEQVHVLIPQGLSIESKDNHAIVLTWEALPGEYTYAVYRSRSENGFYLKCDPYVIQTTHFQDTEISGLNDLWYRITATDTNHNESEMSLPVHAKLSEISQKNFQFSITPEYHIQTAGIPVTYKLLLLSEGGFSDSVSFYLSNLPEEIQTQLEPQTVIPSGIARLKVIIPNTITPGSYPFKINAFGGNRSHELVAGLQVVQLDDTSSAISARLVDQTIRLGEKVNSLGKILPIQFHTSIAVNIRHESETSFRQFTAVTDAEGNYRFDFQPDKMGLWHLFARWEGIDDRQGSQSEIQQCHVLRAKSILSAFIDQKQIQLDDILHIHGKLSPQIANQLIKMKVTRPNGAVELIDNAIHTDANGLYEYHLTIDEEGIWEVETCFEGNETHSGSVSPILRFNPGIKSGHALIVAGGGNIENPLWPTTTYLAERFYKLLIRRQFEPDHIYYISPEQQSQTIIIDDQTPEVADIENYLAALYQDEIVLVDENHPLIIYLTDHGGIDKFKVANGEILNANDLDTWLDQLQEKIDCSVHIIIDACYSGSFIDNLKPTDSQKRVIITSTGFDVAYYDQNGRQSFSQFFFNQIAQGKSLKDSFDITTQKMAQRRLFKGQHPKMADNQDNSLAKTSYIGGSFLIGDDLPVFIEYTPSQIISAGTFELFARVSDVEGIDRVWCSFLPPNFNLPQVDTDFETPNIHLDSIELVQSPETVDLYTGAYTKFEFNGTYEVNVYVMDTGENVISQQIFLTVENGREPSIQGDLNGDQEVNMQDIIMALKILAGLPLSDDIQREASIFGEIGIGDCIYIMKNL